MTVQLLVHLSPSIVSVGAKFIGTRCIDRTDDDIDARMRKSVCGVRCGCVYPSDLTANSRTANCRYVIFQTGV